MEDPAHRRNAAIRFFELSNENLEDLDPKRVNIHEQDGKRFGQIHRRER
jgi:hypothetical protein